MSTRTRTLMAVVVVHMMIAWAWAFGFVAPTNEKGAVFLICFGLFAFGVAAIVSHVED